MVFRIESPAFNDVDVIPKKYTSVGASLLAEPG
jgi:hypothetical protein